MVVDPLQVNAAEAFNTAHVVANHAEELRDELEQLVREWDGLAQGNPRRAGKPDLNRR
jgi:hypothetical protein